MATTLTPQVARSTELLTVFNKEPLLFCMARTVWLGPSPPPIPHPHPTPLPSQDVLYPSEDVEEQLALLSVYPAPESIADEDDDCDEDEDHPVTVESALESQEHHGRNGGGGVSGSGSGDVSVSPAGGDMNLQEKTDEVLRSITSSFAAVTDMFGRKDEERSFSDVHASTTAQGSAATSYSTSNGQVPTGDRGRQSTRVEAAVGAEDAIGTGDGRGGGGRWDIFNNPSVNEMKRRLEGVNLRVGGVDVSPSRASNSASKAGGRGVQQQSPGRFKEDVTTKGARGRGFFSQSLSPPRNGGGGGFGMFGNSFRDFRRRSQEAVNDAVSKLKNALDDSDDEANNDDAWPVERVDGGPSGAQRVRAAAAAARVPRPQDDDPFWRPFGVADDEEPVPLPEPTVAMGTGSRSPGSRNRRRTVASSLPPSAQDLLGSYYGGGGR